MDPRTLRMLDANANRAREAARTLEDMARFALDDAQAAAALKTLRHELSAAMSRMSGERGGPDAMLACRDAAGDVGTAITHTSERKRGSLRDVAIAAGSRLTEALRVLEECAKTVETPSRLTQANKPSPPAPLPQGEGGIQEPSPSGRGLGEGQQSLCQQRHFSRNPEMILKARELRRRMTAPERKLWKGLRHDHNGGLRFRRQHVIGHFIVDFYCPEARLVVEIDGRSHEGAAAQDARREKWLRAQGFEVLRFANDNVLQHPESVTARIGEIARERIASLQPSPPAPLPQGEGGIQEPSPSGRGLGEGQRAETPDTFSETFEQLRHQGYDLAAAVALALGVHRERCAAWKLCVILTESLCTRPWLDVAKLAIDAGAHCLQLREETLTDRELLARARALVRLARSTGVAVIINDRVDIALLAGADGVHVGQSDCSVRDVRKIAGDDLIVGVSASTVDEARDSSLAGADYLGVGAMYTTTTKTKENIAGPELLQGVLSLEPMAPPSLAIGGITPRNIGQLCEMAAGASFGVAVSSAVCIAADPDAVCRTLLDAIRLPSRRNDSASSPERTLHA